MIKLIVEHFIFYVPWLLGISWESSIFLDLFNNINLSYKVL